MVHSHQLPAGLSNPPSFASSSRDLVRANRVIQRDRPITSTINVSRSLRLSHVRRQARSMPLQSNNPSTDGDQGPASIIIPTTSHPNGIHFQGTRRRRVHNSGRDFIDNNTLQTDVLPEAYICAYCGAKLFKFESMDLCCAKGKINLPIVPVPAELLSIYTDLGPEGLHFRRNIRILNHLFSFTSMGVQIDGNLANAQDGVYTFRAHGSIYHRIGSLLPQQGCRPRFLQVYIYDTDHDINFRLMENESIDRALVEKIRGILHQHNPFVHVFQQLGMRQDLPLCRLLIKELRPAQHQYTLPNATQVAAIIVGDDNLFERAQRDIIVQTHGDNLQNVPDTAGFYDPLQYPILLPYGSYGWDINTSSSIGQNISCRAFYAHKLQIRNGYESLLLRGGRLLQQYVVDNWVKIETQKLRYIRDNQTTIRAELYQGLQDSLPAGETIAGNVGRRIVLPASYIGSPRDKYHRYQDAMALVQKYSGVSASVTYRLLGDLNAVLQQYGKTTTEYDLPAYQADEQAVTTNHGMIYEEQSISVSEEDLASVSKLNPGQRYAFNKIIDAVHQSNGSIFFIDGPGGTGKTFLYRAVLATIRQEQKIVLATATSGIAAMILPGGRTAHSKFKIPIRLNNESFCMISKQSELAELLRRASAIIWDETTMTHKHAFEALNRTLKDIIGVDQPFGGKTVIFGGDLRQVLPVVPRGTRSETVNACIIRSRIWDDVQIIHLTDNMRALSDPQFSEFLLRIGEGIEPTVEDNFVRIPDDMVIPWNNNNEISALIDAIFPSLVSNAHDRAYMIERAVLAPTNEYVDQVNESVISVFPGEEIVYHSFDTVEDDTQNLYQQEFLNSISPGGLPPHKLRLKLGSPVILLRNIDPKIGLCNGARMLCRGFQRNLIDAEIITGHFIGTRVFLPRIPLRPSENFQLPLTLIRKQFPIRLSFALTINKAQGQTLPHVGIYLPAHVFSHGQLYVALSRGVSKTNTKVLVKHGKLERQNGTYAKNVVYKEVLLSHSNHVDVEN